MKFKFGRRSNTLHALLSIMHLYSWGYAGLDGRRILGNDAGRGAYALLVRTFVLSYTKANVQRRPTNRKYALKSLSSV